MCYCTFFQFLSSFVLKCFRVSRFNASSVNASSVLEASKKVFLKRGSRERRQIDLVTLDTYREYDWNYCKNISNVSMNHVN